MLTPQNILSYLKAQPFRPFRIHMGRGRTFDIRHPGMVRVGTRDIIIFKFVSYATGLHDDWDTVGLLLNESISHLESSVA
jgi:hypothetical protein